MLAAPPAYVETELGNSLKVLVVVNISYLAS